jgi:hypothetical protein
MNYRNRHRSQTSKNEDSLEKAKFLWDEYKYRHELCWKLLFQITTAVVIILTVPYVRPEIAKPVGKLFLPVLALALSLLSILRLRGEIKILGLIRKKQRDLQWSLFGIKKTRSHFTLEVIAYLICLAILSIIGLVIA